MQSMNTSEFGDRRDRERRWRPKLAIDVAVELGRPCPLTFVSDTTEAAKIAQRRMCDML